MRFWRYALCAVLAVRPHAGEDHALDRGFFDRQITVDGTNYRYRIFVPEAWSERVAWPVILSLHGGGGYGSDGIRQTAEGLAPAIHRHPERFPAIAVFPQVPANGTPGWQEIGGRIALAALEDTIVAFRGDRTRVMLTGLSIGGNGAWFLAFHHPEQFAGLLVVCGFVAERMGTMYPILYPSIVPAAADPAAAVAERVAAIPTWIFHGDSDRTVPVEQSRRMAAALRALGANVRYTELPGVDHNAWDFVYDRLDVSEWLLQQKLQPTPE